jgi:hypothetical protein
MSAKPPAIPRAPAVAAKLEAARDVLRTLEQDVGQFVLDAAEGVTGAAKRLADLRTTIAAAQRDAGELEQALALAAKLDRQAAATAAAKMREEQLVAFKQHFTAREKAMAAVLKAAADMAAAYGEYSEATLQAVTAVPSGAVVPQMAIGPGGVYGAAFGPCERLILAELWRLAPDRKDGIGRFVVPFAKPASEMVRDKPEAVRPGMEELRAADQAILASVVAQIEKLDAAAMRAAGVTPPADGRSAA